MTDGEGTVSATDRTLLSYNPSGSNLRVAGKDGMSRHEGVVSETDNE